MKHPLIAAFVPCALFGVSVLFSAPAEDTPAPIALFQSQDAAGWRIFVEKDGVNPSDVWIFENGILRCTGVGRGYIRTTTAYADYRLKLEWRWPGTPRNSGVMLHLVDTDKIWPKSFEAQLATERAGDFASFGDARSKEEIVSRNPNGVSTGRLARTGPSLEKPPGEWNTYEIIAAGDTITLLVNGTEANRMTRVLPSAGMIGLQCEGAAIDFRNITLTRLAPAKDLFAPMPK